MKTSLHHIIIVALITAFAATMATSAAQDWPGYLFYNGHSSHNALATAILPSNASTLVGDWSFIARKSFTGNHDSQLALTGLFV